MTKKQLMVIIHKDTHYKISDNSDRVVQDLHGWYHPKFIELCKQYNIDYQLNLVVDPSRHITANLVKTPDINLI